MTDRAYSMAGSLKSTPTTRPAGPTISARMASLPMGPHPQSITVHPGPTPTRRSARRACSAKDSERLSSRRRSSSLPSRT